MNSISQVVYHGSDYNIKGNDFNTSIIYFSGNKKEFMIKS